MPMLFVTRLTAPVCRRWCGRLALVAGLLAAAACSPSSLVDVQAPSTVVDPGTVTTPAGAVALRVGALAQMMYTETGTFGFGIIGQSGLLTDELTSARGGNEAIDSRKPTQGNEASENIQSARTYAHIAREALAAYTTDGPATPRAWQGELYALEGYTVLWFAELYCSGIPLTTVPLHGTPIPTRGFSTDELFSRAVTLFDSAAVFGADSAAYVNLARVGKARALIGLGQFAAADSAAAQVPTDFVYRLMADSSGTTQGRNMFPVYVGITDFRVQDHEGGNGLVWSTDPRTGVVTVANTPSTFLWPSKYNVNASGQFTPRTRYDGVPLRLADGLEARLIQAEAALARGDGAWLSTLNTLRSTCIGTTPCAPVPGLTGSSLPALSDPGSDTARVSLLMQERAMWLYLTGHREGDLRRLARIYHRDPGTLWPTGIYTEIAFPTLSVRVNTFFSGQPYGSAVLFQPATAETPFNSLYSGCNDLNP